MKLERSAIVVEMIVVDVHAQGSLLLKTYVSVYNDIEIFAKIIIISCSVEFS